MEIVRYEVIADYRENEDERIKILVCAFSLFALGFMYVLYCLLSESEINPLDLFGIGMLFLGSFGFFYWHGKLQNIAVHKFVEIGFNYIKFSHYLNEPEIIIYFSKVDLLIYHPKRIIFKMIGGHYEILELAGFGYIKSALIKEKLQTCTFNMEQIEFDDLLWTDAMKILIEGVDSADLN